MYGPGTAAVAPGAAGFEAVSAPAESVSSATGPAGLVAGQREPGAVVTRAGFPAPGSQPTRVTDAAAGITPAVVPTARTAELPCMDDPELFFAESPEDVETAKALCVGCAARMACLSGAVERREPWGVWGGELFLRGEIVPRKRPRGRPRKSEVAA